MEKKKGKLVRWIDNKGFGFIKPERGSEDIFIHITALKGMSRKPVVGDIIYFKLGVDKRGKNCALNAEILGVERVMTLEPFQKKDNKRFTGKSTHFNPLLKTNQPARKHKSFSFLMAVILFGGVAIKGFQVSGVELNNFFHGNEYVHEDNLNQQLVSAYKNRLSDIQVTGKGVVSRLLPDDEQGSRHQRFILRLAPGQTLLVAHNIDLADRIDDLQLGDTVEFNGEYEWNAKGGVLHWTHHDPRSHHPNGWLKHRGIRYQ